MFKSILFCIVFLFSVVGHAQVIVGQNCTVPTSMKIFSYSNFGTRMAVQVPWGTYYNAAGYVSACPQNGTANVDKTQWFTFYMKTTDFFKKDYLGNQIGDHMGLMGRSGGFAAPGSFTGSYRGIGPIFHTTWGPVGERYGTGLLQAQGVGCQGIAGNVAMSLIQCPTDGSSPSQKLSSVYHVGANVANINAFNMQDDIVYLVGMHATKDGMSYYIQNTSTLQAAGGWVNKTIDGNFQDYGNHGGFGFFMLCNSSSGSQPCLGYSGISVDLWNIQTGWF